jgi:IS5 family transposase
LDGFRRRKGSKVHALVAPPGLPLAVALSPANSHDATVLPQLMAGLRPGGRRGRPRRRPEELCADGAYHTREIRRHLRQRGIGAGIPENPRGRRRPRRGRAIAFAPPPTG